MKLLILCWIACLFVCRASSEKNKFNGLVDEIIYEMEQDMINKSQTVLELPEIKQSFAKKILFFTLDGSYELSGARVMNLSTIYRVGDVVPVQNDTDGSLSISGTFSMKDLTIRADMLDFKASIFHIHDPLSVNVGKNAASFKVSLTYDEDFNCKASLDYSVVSQLGDFGISLGSGLLTDIENELAQFIMNRLASTIQQAINAHLFPMVNDAIAKLDLCSKLF